MQVHQRRGDEAEGKVPCLGQQGFVDHVLESKEECESLAATVHMWLQSAATSEQARPTTKGDTSARKLVAGLTRLVTMIEAEKQFLDKASAPIRMLHSMLLESGHISAANVKSSNLPYFRAVCHCLSQCADIRGVFETFSYNEGKKRVRVDVVTESGTTWIKVSTKRVRDYWAQLVVLEAEDEEDEDADSDGETRRGVVHHTIYGPAWPPRKRVTEQLGIIKTGQALVRAAKVNPICYRVPRVIITFQDDDKIFGSSSGAECRLNGEEQKFVEYTRMLRDQIVEVLSEHGVGVKFVGGKAERRVGLLSSLSLGAANAATAATGRDGGGSGDGDDEVVGRQNNRESSGGSMTDALLLDVTTLCVLTSSLTHAYRHLPDPSIFDIKPLRFQTEQEQRHPMLPFLARLFAGRRLFTTASAAERLFSIAYVVGGRDERRRCHALLGQPAPASSVIIGPFMAALERKYADSAEDRQASSKQEGELWAEWMRIAEGAAAPWVEIVDDEPSWRMQEFYRQYHEVCCNSRTSWTGRSEELEEEKEKEKEKESGSTNRHRRLTELHRDVFGTADARRWTLVTANTKTARLLSDSGAMAGLSVLLHQPRSLAEARMTRRADCTAIKEAMA
ncbi:hypothetical protein EV182_002168 [Spiromyces aspiralis]|uniref:Uncharacterized protein n=1 Tax=Spiromyces aspiralis TaxID=68401 RepID=A0ACC1HG39_9FUNG|nr:hypothetical protein EV182_002168 [Spiromyces aspiralis]